MEMIAKDKSGIVAELPAACSDETLAADFLERMRWEDQPFCPKCGSPEVYRMIGRDGRRAQYFRWRCRSCKRMYTVRTGTVLEQSLIPLRYWCYAFWAACASKKGVSALQIKRQTGLTYKSALFLMHRIRYAMTRDDEYPPKLGGTVEADETYVGGKPRYRNPSNKSTKSNKAPVFAVVERGGEVRAMTMTSVTAKNLRRALLRNVSPKSRLITDDSKLYKAVGRAFQGGHETIEHQYHEYARGDVHTNTVEGFFSLIKRGIYGTYHAVSKKHLHRYVTEFEFRYNGRKLEDGERTRRAIQGAVGKRLLYRIPVAEDS